MMKILGNSMSLTAEQIEKSRAEFEAHYATQCEKIGKPLNIKVSPQYFASLRNEMGEYPSDYMNDSWGWWLARQETLCVELPDKISVGFGTGRSFTYILIEDLLPAIEAAGIAHK